MVKKTFNLILLGDPASGKGTQAARLVKKYRMYNFDMGQEIRKPSVRALFDYAGTTALGKLTPTSVVRNILHRIIRTVPAGKGILFNGHPKMIGEAQLASKWLKLYKRTDPLVIYLSIPVSVIIARAQKRGRMDDAAEALRNRERYYKQQVSKAVAFFGKHYTLKQVSGMGSRVEVGKKIDAAVNNYLKKI